MDRKRLIAEVKKRHIDTAAGRLEIKKVLGDGGNGVAFLCHRAGKPLVAKVYMPLDARDIDDKSLTRFNNEIKLIKNLNPHPNIVRILDFGSMNLGTYTLPFYVMPYARETLRGLINRSDPTFSTEIKMRVFVRTCLGAAWLHDHGVVHRDLKPENILIGQDGSPWIADLGIAHVNPELFTVGLQTLSHEKLHNRDYYAPEQRFKSANEVDQRADIYALGCILYELFAGMPPVRNNSPALSSISSVLASIDKVVDKMTAFDVANRYSSVHDVVEDVSICFGAVLTLVTGGKLESTVDVSRMVALLKSSNDTQKQHGIVFAKKLGMEALEPLYELLGSSRRDIRDAAAIALGEIGDSSSLPYLVGALYGNGARASTFRPFAETAAQAIAKFDPETRFQALKMINRNVRPQQIATIIEGLATERAFGIVESLLENKLLLTDWAETPLALLVDIDEGRAWPRVSKMPADDMFNASHIVRHLSPQRQKEFLRLWLDYDTSDAWYLDRLGDAIVRSDIDDNDKKLFLGDLEKHIESLPHFSRKANLLRKIHAKGKRQKLEQAPDEHP